MRSKIFGILLGSILTLLSLMAGAHEPTGVWLTQDKDAKIEIYKTSAGSYEGKIIWVKSNKPEVQKKVGVKILSLSKRKMLKPMRTAPFFIPNRKKTTAVSLP